MPIDMEEINVESRMSGAAIIDDLLNRIGERLSKSCDLRQTDT